MKTGMYEFSLFFKVENGAALILAARAQLVAQRACNSMRDAEEALPSDAYAEAARLLLDPGRLPGIEILDSTCE